MANTIHGDWPKTKLDGMSCEQRKKWTRLVYKGESFVRFPASCLQCGAILWCLAYMDESRSGVEKPEGCPAFDDYGNPILITMTGGKKP